MSRKRQRQRRGHRRRWGGVLLAAGVVLLPPGVAVEARASAVPAVTQPAGAIHPQFEELRRRLLPMIRKAQRRYDIPGMSLVLVADGRVVWSEGFGWADRERSIPAGADTVYRAGSLAKLFTAAAVMLLEAEGAVDIDQPISAYLPEFSIRGRFSDDSDPITLRSLLSHHSGLPSDLKKGMWSATDFTEVAAKLGDEHAAYPPNLIFSYSNVGYTLLGHMVERQSGIPFSRFVGERLLAPLGLSHTAFTLRGHLDPFLARGYRDGEPAEPLPIRDLPAYGLHTSVNDLARFIIVLQGKGSSPLDPYLVEQMMEAQNEEVPLDMEIRTGLGWFLEEGTIPGAGKVVRHGGTTLLYGSELILLPEQGLGVAVMANAAGSRSVVKQLAEAVLMGALGEEPPNLPEPNRAGLDDETMFDHQARPAEADGRYATQLGLVAIETGEERICACMMEKRLRLVPLPGGWFKADSDGEALPGPLAALGHFHLATREIGGREVIVAAKGGRHLLLGEKIADRPMGERWQERTGRYRITNPDEGFPLLDVRLSEEHGAFCLSYRAPALTDARIRVPLQPVSENEAVILGLGRGRGETVRFYQEGGELRLHYSGYEARWVGR